MSGLISSIGSRSGILNQITKPQYAFRSSGFDSSYTLASTSAYGIYGSGGFPWNDNTNNNRSFDIGGIFDPAAGTMTCPVSGVWAIGANVWIDGVTDGDVLLVAVFVGSNEVLVQKMPKAVDADTIGTANFTHFVYANVGEVVSIKLVNGTYARGDVYNTGNYANYWGWLVSSSK